jgi:hypothetical protein
MAMNAIPKIMAERENVFPVVIDPGLTSLLRISKLIT